MTVNGRSSKKAPVRWALRSVEVVYSLQLHLVIPEGELRGQRIPTDPSDYYRRDRMQPHEYPLGGPGKLTYEAKPIALFAFVAPGVVGVLVPPTRGAIGTLLRWADSRMYDFDR